MSQAFKVLQALAGKTLATAESCTGGMVAAKLVNYPGISAALNEAHVTYANEAKVKYCGVKPETLMKHGAVSEETAREMAQGLREKSGADIAAATTGIAGPGGGTPEKPVGRVYVGVSMDGYEEVRELNIGNGLQTREYVRFVSASNALDLARKAIISHK